MSSTSEAPDAPPPVEAGVSPTALAAAREPHPQISDEPDTAAAKPHRAARRGVGVAVLALGFLAGVAGALLVSVLPLRLPGSAGFEVARLSAALDKAELPALKSRIAELEKRAATLPADAASDVAALHLRLSSAEQQVNLLATQLAAISVPAAGTPGALAGGDLRAMTSGLAASFAELKGRVEALGADVQVARNLSGRLGALESRVPADLGAQLAALAAKGDLSALDGRLSKLESNTSAFDAKRAASAIALANLVRSAQSGAAFTTELEAVRLINPDPDLVGPVAAYASHGVRPVSQLASDFPQVARDAMRAAGRGSGSWWDRLWASITGLFLIRSQQPRAGDSIDAVLSRAEAAVRARNLQEAVGELSHLQGPAAAAVAAWRAQAEARLTLDSLLTKLSARILAELHG